MLLRLEVLFPDAADDVTTSFTSAATIAAPPLFTLPTPSSSVCVENEEEKYLRKAKMYIRSRYVS